MKIAMIAPPFERVPPPYYGGTERVVSLLTEGLVRRGHDVTLFATGDSTTSASLVSYFDEPIRPYDERLGLLHYALALRDIGDSFDVIHNHNWNYSCIGSLAKVPMVTTLHNDHSGLFSLPAFQSLGLNFIAISQTQAQRTRGRGVQVDSVIRNAIDLGRVPPVRNPSRSYLAFLGNVAWYKGAHIAIQAAIKAGRPIRIAGKLDGNEKSNRFFAEHVEPYLQEGWVEYVGELNDAQKYDFLSNAQATLCPLQWDEPFGLVMLESLACGTPPIAFDRGAAREVIGDQAGFVVSDLDAMVAAIAETDRVSSSKCRARAASFNVEKMVDEYVLAYGALSPARS
jgi:glycosyltransferase involved in cell wall biosynthesis